MALEVREIFGRLREWPHRAAGSEEELEARETLITLLSSEPDVDIAEEGFFGPTSYLPFIWIIAVGCASSLLMSAAAPLFAFGVAILFVGSHFLYFDWRVSPLIWLGAKTVCANLVARKGQGERLIILMAHLDSAPASFAYRPSQVGFFKEAVFAASTFIALCAIIPMVEAQGAPVPFPVKLLVATIVLGQAALATIDRVRFGFTPGANDNLTGVAAATSLASKLWRGAPQGTEVRLLITSGEEAGMLGAQHYWRHHRAELQYRDTHILNFDTVGSGALSYVVESGGFTPVRYEGALAMAAERATTREGEFGDIRPAVHHVGDFDTVWFARDGISALTLAAYDSDGRMPHIHTMEDRAAHVDLALVERAVSFGEAVIRALPEQQRKSEEKS